MGRRDLDLEYIEDDSPDFIPYEPSPLGRVFRFGDVSLALTQMPRLKAQATFDALFSGEFK